MTRRRTTDGVSVTRSRDPRPNTGLRPDTGLRFLAPWQWVVCSIAAALLSFTSIFGIYYQTEEAKALTLPMLIIESVLWTPVALVLLVLLLKGFRALVAYCRGRSTFERFTPRLSPRSIIVFTLIMFACWLPYLIIFFPGTMNYDTWFEMYQFYPENGPVEVFPGTFHESAQFCDHHPIIDTLIFGSFSWASEALTGNSNVGVFAYSVIQSLLTACVFTIGIAYLRRRGASTAFCFIAYGFFCVVPFYPLDAITMVKDTIFSWIYVAYFLILIEIAFTKGEALRKPWLAGLFLLFCILGAVTKKTGLYQIVLTNLVLMFIYRKAWIPLLASWLVPALISIAIIPTFLFPAINAIPGGSQATLAPLFQQTARMVHDHPEDISDEERAVIDRVLNYDTLADRYELLTMDPVLNEWNYDSTGDDIKAYLGVYLQQGLRHPLTYVKASLPIMLGYLNPTTDVFVHYEFTDYKDGRPYFEMMPALQPARTYIQTFYQGLYHIPLANVLFRLVLYSWWLPMFFFLYVLFWQRKRLPLCIAILSCLCAVLIAPVIIARYAYPMIYLAPLLVCLMSATGDLKGAGRDEGTGRPVSVGRDNPEVLESRRNRTDGDDASDELMGPAAKDQRNAVARRSRGTGRHAGPDRTATRPDASL